jgi:uncharacterized protein YndB with AHSA1/START domain
VATPFRFDRAWHFAATPELLWATFERTDHYQAWWPWLRTLDLDGEGLTAGASARVVIQAPLPYQLRCTVEVEDAEPARRLVARVRGDLDGPARLELEPAAEGTDARLAWSLAVRAPLLRPAATLARPALAWAHDRIVERGLVQFEARALERAAEE